MARAPFANPSKDCMPASGLSPIWNRARKSTAIAGFHEQREQVPLHHKFKTHFAHMSMTARLRNSLGPFEQTRLSFWDQLAFLNLAVLYEECDAAIHCCLLGQLFMNQSESFFEIFQVFSRHRWDISKNSGWFSVAVFRHFHVTLGVFLPEPTTKFVRYVFVLPAE
jgi:hypothetical protein